MENELDNQESLNSDTEVSGDEGTNMDIDLEAEEIRKANEYAKNQKIRAEKAEAELKRLKEKPTPTKEAENFSLQDIRALQDVNDSDVDEVVNYAKYKGITISDAKSTSVIRTFLKEKEEERKTALAANTGSSSRGTSKISSDKILEDFSQGNVPDTEEGLAELARLRFEAKKKKGI